MSRHNPRESQVEHVPGFKELAEEVRSLLYKNSVNKLVRMKIGQFEWKRDASNDSLFLELCFCILAANFKADKSLKIQTRLGRKLISLPEEELAKELKHLGHRFYRTRARYIVRARRFRNIGKMLSLFKDGKEAREWLRRNVKGLGMKEASHFLRNIGFKDVAIVDRHIIKLLANYGLIEEGKSLTKRQYLAVEEYLSRLAAELNLTLAELDLYLWYLETGKIVK